MLKKTVRPIYLSSFLLLFLTVFSTSVVAENTQVKQSIAEDINFSEHFIAIKNIKDSQAASRAIETITNHWHRGLVPMALETISYAWTSPHRPALIELLRKETLDAGAFGVDQWYQWLWNTSDFKSDSSYHQFKTDLYKTIDHKFERYFKDREKLTRIRLDEVQWGGVVQDGIPPLRNPKMISAKEASYLEAVSYTHLTLPTKRIV